MACAPKLILRKLSGKPLCTTLLVSGRRDVACSASRYRSFKDNSEQYWERFFDSPDLHLDHRQSKAKHHFADFTLKGNIDVALFIEKNDAELKTRLLELDNEEFADFKAGRSACLLLLLQYLVHRFSVEHGSQVTLRS